MGVDLERTTGRADPTKGAGDMQEPTEPQVPETTGVRVAIVHVSPLARSVPVVNLSKLRAA